MKVIDYNNFNKSLLNLEKRNREYENLDSTVSNSTKEAYLESTVHRYMICWEIVVQTLKLYLKHEKDVRKDISSPEVLIKTAAKLKLLPSPCENWLEYRSTRNEITHEYNADIVDSCMKKMGNFVVDAVALYETLSNKKWKPLKK